MSYPDEYGTAAAMQERALQDKSTKRVSPVNEACERLCHAQDRELKAIQGLTQMLDVALSPDAPPAVGGANAQASAPVSSELEARLLSSVDRSNAMTSRIENLMQRLTL